MPWHSYATVSENNNFTSYGIGDSGLPKGMRLHFEVIDTTKGVFANPAAFSYRGYNGPYEPHLVPLGRISGY